MSGSVRALCGSGELECIDRDKTARAVAAVCRRTPVRFYYGSITEQNITRKAPRAGRASTGHDRTATAGAGWPLATLPPNPARPSAPRAPGGAARAAGPRGAARGGLLGGGEPGGPASRCSCR